MEMSSDLCPEVDQFWFSVALDESATCCVNDISARKFALGFIRLYITCRKWINSTALTLSLGESLWTTPIWATGVWTWIGVVRTIEPSISVWAVDKCWRILRGNIPPSEFWDDALGVDEGSGTACIWGVPGMRSSEGWTSLGPSVLDTVSSWGGAIKVCSQTEQGKGDRDS